MLGGKWLYRICLGTPQTCRYHVFGIYMVTVYVRANILIHGDLTALLLIQTYDWLEGLVHMRGVWRSTTMVPGGALCVMITGICRMP